MRIPRLVSRSLKRKPGQGAGRVMTSPYPASVDDDFTGTNGDQPNTELWEPLVFDGLVSLPVAEIRSNKLYMEFVQDNVSNGNGNVRVYAIYSVGGDFDIQVDFDFTSLQSSTKFKFELPFPTATTVGSWFYNNGGVYTMHSYIAGIEDSIGLTNAFGSMRLIRSGSTISMQYKDGAGAWTPLASRAHTTEDAQPRLSLSGYNTGRTYNGNFDNFILNSGTVVWP